MSSSITGAQEKPSKRRADMACTKCRAKKLKCENSGTKVPCKRCESTGHNCVFIPVAQDDEFKNKSRASSRGTDSNQPSPVQVHASVHNRSVPSIYPENATPSPGTSATGMTRQVSQNTGYLPPSPSMAPLSEPMYRPPKDGNAAVAFPMDPQSHHYWPNMTHDYTHYSTTPQGAVGSFVYGQELYAQPHDNLPPRSEESLQYYQGFYDAAGSAHNPSGIYQHHSSSWTCYENVNDPKP